VLRYIRTIASAQALRSAADVELLRGFMAARDDAAFAEIVRRYGPVVLGVCRRVLGHEADAEDAFQAVFLILARKAGAIARPALLGNWLYGVALKTALRARAQRARRKEVGLVDRPIEGPAQTDWHGVLDNEINRLPERLRVPFVLCYVEGKTNEEAARLIGCPKGTVLSRLSSARERLRRRLSQKGIVPSLAALSAASVSATLAGAAVQVAVSPAAASPNARTLMEGVLRSMSAAKRNRIIGWALAALLMGAGIVSIARQPAAAEPPAEPPAAVNEQPKPAKAPAKDDTMPQREEWSEAAAGLRGRLLPVVRQKLNGTPILGLTLELANVSTGSLAFKADPEFAKVEVFDSTGKAVRQSGLPRSGPVPNPEYAVIPRDSYLGLPLDILTVGIPPNKGALLSLRNADWVLEPGRYTIRASFAAASSAVRVTVGGADAQPTAWADKLTLPAVVIEVGNDGVSVLNIAYMRSGPKGGY
jgi:RNA polymerase sigma factor (sigma-70 family)